MKQGLFKLWIIAIALFVSTKSFAVDVKIGGLYYNVTRVTKQAEVIAGGGLGNAYAGTVEIPEKIKYNGLTYNVVAIAPSAFAGCQELTAVKIPKSVTSIGTMAFKDCGGLENIEVNAANPTFDSRDNCNAIIETGSNTLVAGCKTTQIPNNILYIGNYAFSTCRGLSNIVLPASVLTVGDYAFAQCSSLTSVVTGNSLTSIGYCAFQDCSSLTSVTIGKSVSSIGYCAFDGCTSLRAVHVSDIASWCNISFEKVEANPLSYARHLYVGSDEVKDLVIPEGVSSINDYAFCHCSGLTSIDIPGSVIFIGDSVFWDCSDLESIAVSPENAVYDSRNNCNAIIETASNTLLVGCKNTNIQSSVRAITAGAFYGCSNLKSISIPDNITAIGDYAFYDCKVLNSVTIGSNVTSIGDYAFYGCGNLTSLRIPASVTTIGKDALGYCSSLESLVVDESNPNYDSRDNCNAIVKTRTNALVAGCKNSVILSSVTSIGPSAFLGCSGLTTVLIPTSVTSIGAKAFSACNLTSVNIPGSVRFIDKEAFANCPSLSSVELSSNIKSIASGLFSGCGNLASLSIPANVSSVGASAFANCVSLAAMDIPTNVTSLGDNAFAGCSALASVTIPNSVTSIGAAAFADCVALPSVEIPASVMTIGDMAFANCKELSSVKCLAVEAPLTPPNAFLGVKERVVILSVPDASQKVYKSSAPWTDFAKIVAVK
ncbi:MAG: leucine-rich repeat domain-containing protein [Bacteroidaceae bacterium]|nr:leucine-rich repeat domain-containing protein [Bacteroidaceae bacterium]